MNRLALFIVSASIAIGCSQSSDTHAAPKSNPPPKSTATTPPESTTPANKPPPLHPPPVSTPPAVPATTPPTKDEEKAANYPADNSGKNVRDKDGSTLTPTDQSASEADVAITKAVREAIVALPDASMNAKNVKVVTVAGVVTLRGPVASDEEKTRVAAAAKGATGVIRVEDLLEVETK